MRSGRKTRDGEEKEGRRKGRQKAAGWLEPAEEWAEQLRHKGYILRRLVPWLPRNTTIRGAERWFAFCLRSVSLRKEYDSHCISISDVSRNGANHWFSNSFKEPALHFVAGAGSDGDL